MIKYSFFTVLLCTLTLLVEFNSISYASEQPGSHGKHEHAADKPTHHDKKHEHSHHSSSSHWRKNLNKKQKIDVDKMHHELDRKTKALKENEKQKQKQLNTLTINNKADQSAINKTIDELMAVKNKILRHRHEHLIEMRLILNNEQRVSYDEEILKRHKIR